MDSCNISMPFVKQYMTIYENICLNTFIYINCYFHKLHCVHSAKKRKRRRKIFQTPTMNFKDNIMGTKKNKDCQTLA